MKFDLVNKIPLKLRKRSPEILAVTGVIGVVITFIGTMLLYKDEEADKIDAEG